MNEGQPRDHAPDEPDHEMPRSAAFEDHVKSRTTWLRFLFMIVFIFLYFLSRLVVITVVALQFLWVLFTGETNDRLRSFGQSLATYTFQIIRYLTYNTDVRPFPFDEDWPPGNADTA